jgi:flagellin
MLGFRALGDLASGLLVQWQGQKPCGDKTSSTLQNAMEARMLSVNTNYGAMVALQNLNRTNSELNSVQTRINTGLKVATAKDDGGLFAIAQRMRSDVSSFDAVKNSLDRGISVVDTALAAGTAISDILVEMKGKALAAANTSLDTASRTSLNADFVALRTQISTIVSNASFNGVNLINNTATAGVRALANVTGSTYLTVDDENMSLGGTVVSVAAAQQVDTAANASTALTAINNSMGTLNAALARLGTGSKALTIHKEFVSKQQDETSKGIGNLVDADLAKESARLQALQVKQQLGVQALSIANQSPQSLLGLFR